MQFQKDVFAVPDKIGMVCFIKHHNKIARASGDIFIALSADRHIISFLHTSRSVYLYCFFFFYHTIRACAGGTVADTFSRPLAVRTYGCRSHLPQDRILHCRNLPLSTTGWTGDKFRTLGHYGAFDFDLFFNALGNLLEGQS